MFYKIVIALLLISNILLVFFLLTPHRRDGMPDRGPKDVVIRELHLQPGQIKDYDVLIQKHRNDIGRADQRIRALKYKLYTSLGTTMDGSYADSVIKEMALVQAEIEQTHLQHFKDIREICHPDQQQYYDQLILKLTDLFFSRPSHK